jgi:hypothetical protein
MSATPNNATIHHEDLVENDRRAIVATLPTQSTNFEKKRFSTQMPNYCRKLGRAHASQDVPSRDGNVRARVY